ncbi:hypothetical protein JCM6882_000313 [Rhodosporidiobolus microsporus]
MAVQSLEAPAPASYPPQNSLQAALNTQHADESLATVHLDGQGEGAQAGEGKTAEGEDEEAMRLRGGCFNLGLCGCPDWDCCIIPCTIS